MHFLILVRSLVFRRLLIYNQAPPDSFVHMKKDLQSLPGVSERFMYIKALLREHADTEGWHHACRASHKYFFLVMAFHSKSWFYFCFVLLKTMALTVGVQMAPVWVRFSSGGPQ